MDDKKPIAYVMRHGDTDLNDDNAFRGMLDPCLNDEGVVQAHKAAEFLSRQNIERVICSPLHRAVQTAEIVSGTLGGRCIEQSRCLFPWQIAPLYGKDKDEFAEALDHFVDNPTETPKNGESLSDFIERVGDFFEDKLCPHCVTLFVCHTSNIVALNDIINGTSEGSPESGEVVAPGGICAIYCDEDEDGGYEIEPIFGETHDAEFGS